MSTKITPANKINPFSLSFLKELFSYRDLLYMLVKREVNVLYKQTLLGFAWAIVKPFLQMVVFTLVFGRLVNFQNMLDSGLPYAVFSFAALVPWTYFSTALTSASGSLISNSTILTKVYFPRMIAPMTNVIAKLLDFAIALVVLFGMLLFYGIMPTVNLVFLPLMILLMVMLVLGMSLWLSALSITYRDVQQLMAFVVQLMMFGAPVVWPLNVIPDEYRIWLGLYPMSGIIEGFRVSITGIGTMPWDMLLTGSISTIFILFSGIFYFKNKEYKLSDVI